MADEQPYWTSDQLLNPEAMRVYTEQIRAIFRDHKAEFRNLGDEVFGDLVADPMPEDNPAQARLHAWQVARILRRMERHTQAVVALARQLDATYQRVYVELPRKRQAKAAQRAAAKELHAERRARQAVPQARPGREELVSPDAEVPAFDLFRGSR
ncbi:hypothetical protein [Embleya hyalina]|uniref:Uncharacterized protein n=1 Tax=Embleya hyalina TaxID=516124 RepID=A0A401YYM0_9ACTN|nr:hypothetical protein [Embleya hyalina]GCD99736.1 hypothetical protein EHYA_07458 [Embleya hyalina]